MPFDLSTAIAVREREDGLLEKDTFDLPTANSIEDITGGAILRAAKPGEIPYRPAPNKAQAVIEQMYKEEGKEVPAGLKFEWELTSPQKQALTGAVLSTVLTGGLYPIVQAARGAAAEGAEGSIIGNVFKGIAYPDVTPALYKRLPGTKDLPPWAEITAEISESIIEYGLLGLAKAAMKQELLAKDITRKLDTAAELAVKDKLAETLPAGPVAEEALKTELKNKFKAEALKKLTALEAELSASEATIGEGTQSGGPSVLQSYARKRSLLGLVIEDLQHMGEEGQIKLPKVGQTVGFKDAEGIVQQGIIKEITDKRVTIDMMGRQIVVTLSQLNLPKVEQPTGEGKEQIGGIKIVTDRGAIPGEPLQTLGDKAALIETEEGKFYIQRADESKVYNPKTKSPLFDNTEDAWNAYKLSTAIGEGQKPPIELPKAAVGGEPAPVINKYVKNEPIEINIGEGDKETAKSLREEFAGVKNAQIVRGKQLSDEIKQLVPDKAEREAMFWYKAANGDMETLTAALKHDAFIEYHDSIKKALNLSPQAKEVLAKIEQYYTEAGQVSQEVGTIKNVRENYMNRIYKPEPPQDYVKSELGKGLKQTTSHAKHRVYETEFEAVAGGKKFATTDIADALAIHNEELARVNTSRKLADTMVKNKIAAWKKEIPEGWAKVGNLEKRVPIKDKEGNAVIGEEGNQLISSSSLVAPEGIAKGLEAITDPNFVKKIDELRGLQRYQGLVKTVDLSYSFFHHFTMAAQVLYQGGISTLMRAPIMNETLKSKAFGEIEQDFVAHTGMTTSISANQDIMRKLIEDNPDMFSKITSLPVIKQGLEGAQASSRLLFDRIQRFIKVSDYGKKISNWIVKNPDATNAQVKVAKIGFAKEINAAYGGLNWEAMGIGKSQLSLLRFVLLAPDWTISNIFLGGYSFKGGTQGNSARWHIATALLGGLLLIEFINKLLTGHFTDENDKGHKFEIEVSPHVYVSLLRGGIGDIVKLTSMMVESGPIAGMARFAQGKLAPIPRTAVGLLSGTKYTGAPITKQKSNALEKTLDYMSYIYQNAGPHPFGLSNLWDYIVNEPEKNLLSGIAIATGLARYAKPGKKRAKHSL